MVRILRVNKLVFLLSWVKQLKLARPNPRIFETKCKSLWRSQSNKCSRGSYIPNALIVPVLQDRARHQYHVIPALFNIQRIHSSRWWILWHPQQDLIDRRRFRFVFHLPPWRACVRAPLGFGWKRQSTCRHAALCFAREDSNMFRSSQQCHQRGFCVKDMWLFEQFPVSQLFQQQGGQRRTIELCPTKLSIWRTLLLMRLCDLVVALHFVSQSLLPLDEICV